MTSSASGDARNRLPREPYPGLRPFLDFEAALLFGRERQVRDVIEHLRLTQFVAVLGGSGSGKSSLIHAGVVPELRSFGIPGAGDLWLPMTCTPGTNVNAADSAARLHSPVTRLARRFAGLLKSRGSEEADAQRLIDIGDVFRQEAGFARLLDTFGGELSVPPGPDPADARVLFVLDQFEEIFHPTNKGVADATLLVERVLDHFFNPHPRCHVVLTMRSEHLNDCASFLELPDAINKSSYLVRRLDDDELREAIVGPAQRFLRLVARSQGGDAAAPALPAEVLFEPNVLARLLRDVKAITHDPDHLPLLQHLLARLWEAALEREEINVPVPSHVTEIDLVRAVSGGRAGVSGDEQPLDERTNTLRACVENWPETIYKWQGETERAQLDTLFSHLAYKDPNTGLYSQQRVDVDAMAGLLGPDKTRADLRALLAEGFLGSVDYLFWDDEDPTRVTLKVSHETFIRGWGRFRQLIDRESDRFDEFVGVLRRCGAWAFSGRNEDLLLEAGEMRLLRESGFEKRLAAPGQHQAWFRFLQSDRDGARLGRLEPELEGYLRQSGARLGERERSLRSRRRWLWVSTASFLLLPPALFSIYIQGPVTERAELLLDAGTRANRVPLTPDYPTVGAAAAPLESLLRAAELIDEARSGQSTGMTRFSQWLLEHLSALPWVRRQAAFLNGMAAQTEPPVNGKLRQLLATAAWPGALPLGDDSVFELPSVHDTPCTRRGGADAPGDLLQGRLFVVTSRNPEPGLRRGLFVPVVNSETDSTLALYAATYNVQTKACLYGQIAASVPLFLNPSVLLDATLRYMVYTAAGVNVETPSVTLQEFDWDRVEDTSSRVLQTQVRAVVTDADLVWQLRQRVAPGDVALVPSWRSPGGRTLAVAGQPWRMVSPSALRLQVDPADARFVPLQPARVGSPCIQLSADWTAQPGFRLEMFEHELRCYAITRGNPPNDGLPGDTVSAREQVLVAVYERPSGELLQHLKDKPPAPLASLSQFARLAEGDRAWLIGVKGDFAGWLAVRGEDPLGTERLLAAPLSTCALRRLGLQLHAAAVAAGAASAPLPRASGGAVQGLCADR